MFLATPELLDYSVSHQLSNAGITNTRIYLTLLLLSQYVDHTMNRQSCHHEGRSAPCSRAPCQTNYNIYHHTDTTTDIKYNQQMKNKLQDAPIKTTH